MAPTVVVSAFEGRVRSDCYGGRSFWPMGAAGGYRRDAATGPANQGDDFSSRASVKAKTDIAGIKVFGPALDVVDGRPVPLSFS